MTGRLLTNGWLFEGGDHWSRQVNGRFVVPIMCSPLPLRPCAYLVLVPQSMTGHTTDRC